MNFSTPTIILTVATSFAVSANLVDQSGTAIHGNDLPGDKSTGLTSKHERHARYITGLAPTTHWNGLKLLFKRSLVLAKEFRHLGIKPTRRNRVNSNM
jgi:hypothetical protein